MNREQSDLSVIDFIAPAGGVTGGKMYQTGSLVVVAMGGRTDIAEGDTASGILCIHTQLDAKTGESWSYGDDLFFDGATSKLTKTDSGSLFRVAKATASKESDADTGWALFDGGVAAYAQSAALLASLAKADAALPAAKIESKLVTVALGQSTGSSGADADWVGATVIGVVEVSGSDKVRESCAVDGIGAVLLTLAAATTAEATYRVTARLA